MGFLTDLLKDLPLTAVLREKIATFEEEIASLKQENASLKDEKRELQAENKRLKDEIESLTHTDELHQIEHDIMVISEEGREIWPETLAERLNIPTQRAEYHLQELVTNGYLKDSYGYPISQKGRKYLIDHDLL